MAKLNKQEINAIANKLLRVITEQSKLDKNRFIAEYIPSPIYLKAESLINRYLKLEKEQSEIIHEKDRIFSDLRNLKVLDYYNQIDFKILDNIMDKKYTGKEIPSINSIKEDLIIADIDEDFNVDEYIKNKLLEYNKIKMENEILNKIKDTIVPKKKVINAEGAYTLFKYGQQLTEDEIYHRSIDSINNSIAARSQGGKTYCLYEFDNTFAKMGENISKYFTEMGFAVIIIDENLCKNIKSPKILICWER